jgi:hypothetical protein
MQVRTLEELVCKIRKKEFERISLEHGRILVCLIIDTLSANCANERLHSIGVLLGHQEFSIYAPSQFIISVRSRVTYGQIQK